MNSSYQSAEEKRHCPYHCASNLHLLGWGELGCVECPNPSNTTVSHSIGTEYGSKSSKLGPDIPLGVHNQPQPAMVGANLFTLLLEPNHQKPGTRIHNHTRNSRGNCGIADDVPTKSFPGTETLIGGNQSTLLNNPQTILCVGVSPLRKVLQTLSHHSLA